MADLLEFIRESEEWTAGSKKGFKKKPEEDTLAKFVQDSEQEVKDYYKRKEVSAMREGAGQSLDAKKRAVQTAQGYWITPEKGAGHTTAVMKGQVQANKEEYESRRRKYLRDTFAYGLTEPLKGLRKSPAKLAAKELTDPIDRQWLAEEVGKVSEQMESSRKREYSKKGFAGRFLERGGQVAGEFTGGGTEMLEAAKKLTGFAGGKMSSPEDVRFLQGLEAAKASKYPDVPKDVGLSGKAATGAASMAPDMAGGLLAFMGLGPAGAMSYWTARVAPERVESYRAAGMSSAEAVAAGSIEAAGEAAIELINIDPTGLMKRGLSGPLKKAIIRSIETVAKRVGGKPLASLLVHPVVREAVGAGKRIGLETLEEGLQGGLESIGQSVAEYRGGSISSDATIGGELVAAGKSGLSQMAEAAPGIAVLGGVGSGGRLLSERKQLHKVVGKVLESADSDKTPSRSQWRDWGLDPKDGKSAKQRKEGVQQAAEAIRQQATQVTEETAVVQGAPVVQEVAGGEQKQAVPSLLKPSDTPGQKKTASAISELLIKQTEGQVSGRKVHQEVASESPYYVLTNVPIDSLSRSEDADVVPSKADLKKGPVIVRANGEILDGRHRVANAKLRGETEIEAWVPIKPPSSEQTTPTISEGTPEVMPFARGQTEEVIAPVTEVISQEQVEFQPLRGVNAEQSEAGKFITGEEGKIGVSLEALSKAKSFTKHALQKFLTSRGELPADIFRKEITRRGDVSRTQRQLSFIVKDYDKAVKEVYGKGPLHSIQIEAIDAALKGEVPLDALPEPLRNVVGTMRTHIDVLSRALIDSGAVQGKLETTVTENLGSYVTRSYRAFDDPKWADNVPKEVRNKAEALLRQEYPGKTEEEMQGLISNILFEGKAAETPVALLKGSNLGAKDLSILTQRKEIPPEIRALLGEYKDPRLNYARSVTKMGNLIANHLFLDDVKQMGMGTFFSDSPINNEYGELKTRIAADESSPMYPLNGLYTTPELKTAFQNAVAPNKAPTWLKLVLAANGTVKISKTVASLMTHVRNLVGNHNIALRNGHFNIGNMRSAWKGTMTGLLKKEGDGWRNYYLRAVELGIVRQDVHSGELRDYIKESIKGNIDENITSTEVKRRRKTLRTATKVAETVADVYQAEDDIWKLYGWENEKDNYRKAYPEWDNETVEIKAAEIINNVTPTYSMVPEAVRTLRKIPIVGPFVSFPAEMIRNTYHTLNYAKQELANPRTRAIGSKRLVGTILSMSEASAIAAAMRFLVGVSWDDDKDMREFVPPWQKNSAIAHLGRSPDGSYKYIDLAYSDPSNYITKPFRAFFTGGDLKEGLWEGMKEIAEPFAGEEILFKALTETWRNTTDYGRVYNPEDTVNQQAKDITAHIWSAFEPGTLTSIKRVGKGIAGFKAKSGRAYDPTIESIAMITGQRIAELDIKQALPYKASEFIGRERDVNGVLYDLTNSRGTVSPDDIKSTYIRVDGLRRNLFNETSKTIHAAMRLGVSDSELIQLFRSKRVSEHDMRALMAGAYVPFELTRERAKSIIAANPEEAEARINAIFEAQKEITK